MLPETALTGYVSPLGDFDLTRFAEPIGGATCAALAAMAQRHRVAIAGPLVEASGGAVYNALVVFDHEGELVGHFRKRHPWYPEAWATPGDLGTPVVTIAGARVTACICFDVHFIADDAPDALASADVCLFPSAWVERGADSRDALLPALARRFEVAIVNANWGVGAPWLGGQGHSRIIDARGEELARAPHGGAPSLTASSLDLRKACD